MTSAHFIYIPGIVLLGIVIGYILGGRAAQLSGNDKAGKDDVGRHAGGLVRRGSAQMKAEAEVCGPEARPRAEPMPSSVGA